jgi:ribonuclease HI
MEKQIYEVYTDGACSNNQAQGGQPGGWAAIFVDGRAVSGGEMKTTNNRMEMTAVIEALKEVPEGHIVKIYSDSAYIINCFLNKWINQWEKNGWMTSQKKPVENQDLWMEMRALQQKRDVEWIKVKGHSGNVWNEKADKLAVSCIPNHNKPVSKPVSRPIDSVTITLTHREIKALLCLLEQAAKNEEHITLQDKLNFTLKT